MHVRLFRSATLKQRVFGVIIFLIMLPVITLAWTYHLNEVGDHAEQASETANAGVIKLNQLNAAVYAVVMESRGIYMSPDWQTAEPFAKGLQRQLTDLQKIIGEWRQHAIESEKPKIEALSVSIENFVQFRAELVRLAREVSTAKAREFGDNDENRQNRSALNNQLVELAKAYSEHQRRAQDKVQESQLLNMRSLLVLALAALVIGTIGLIFVHRTVIMLFNRMRLVMVELASGNLNAEFSGVERKDEIGDFARALYSFKRAAIEKLQFEKDTEEQRRRSEADRRAVEARVMEDLNAAVGSVVAAAVIGDFSKRVPLDGKQDAIRDLAESLNAMCERIGQAMGEVFVMMRGLAQGDLRGRLRGEYQGTFGQLKGNVNDMVEKLSTMILQIKAATDEVTNATVEIATGTTDLSQRTEQQAAALEQTSASMKEVHAAVKKNADGAHRASESAALTREIASRGSAVVAEAVEAMSRIESSSRRISDIIGVIDEIASQTNLLALNAAVEAARAGDAGRGFSVVAGEVRNLAQRSSQAAKDIARLIHDSTNQVKEGVKLVNGTGRQLKDIADSINDVAALVSEIAQVSAEQAKGIDHINKALSQIDEMTHQNSALVEQSSAAATALEGQAATMKSHMAFFKIEDISHSSSADLAA
jgi:methyl-accepting chemotaxis protein